jgi:hypothetical protein
MDTPSRPLTTWERVYWRLFAVFGTFGLLHEVYVMENRGRLFAGKQSRDVPTLAAVPSADLIRGNHACNSHRLLTDDEVTLCEPSLVPPSIDPL